MPTLYDTTARGAEIGLRTKAKWQEEAIRTASMDTEGGTECAREEQWQKRSENSRALASRSSEDDMLLVGRVQLRDQLQDVAFCDADGGCLGR